jgi:hypothetical protein
MMIQYVDGSDTAWAYTIGRLRSGLPELIVTGLPPGPSGTLLNSVHRLWDELTIEDGFFTIPEFEDPFALIEVPTWAWESEYFLGARRDVASHSADAEQLAFQIVWSDSNGDYPWTAATSGCQCNWQPIVGLQVA